MTSIMITDIRKSGCDSGFDLVTAIFPNKEVCDTGLMKPLDSRCILILESATSRLENPEIGVHPGDQYIRMRAKKGHGLRVGEEVQLDGIT